MTDNQVFVEISGHCSSREFFPPLQYNPGRQTVFRWGLPPETQSVIIRFPSEEIFEEEHHNNCLVDCVPLFQAMLQQGWVYERASPLWVQRSRVEKDEAINRGFIIFKGGMHS